MNKIEEFKSFVNKYTYTKEIEVVEDKITLRGYLDLRGTQIKELPDNLTVGGYLDLSGTPIKELPSNLIAYQVYQNSKVIHLDNLKYGYNKERKYIYYDGILWGNVKTVKRRDNITIYRTPLGYCVVEKELSAHGKTLKEAIEDLTFKKLKHTNQTEIMKAIKKTGKITRLQYRAITGACKFGTEQFCEQHNIKEEQEEISIKELKKILTLDNYGAETFWELYEEVQDE